ncbi:ABC transporter permease subunit [Ruminococcaceae bacterium OttesenSCG-928-A11]|nr:ABC transporter permease subunit [Ruminococcaceae bacterium OttesenSCG-928-A11]
MDSPLVKQGGFKKKLKQIVRSWELYALLLPALLFFVLFKYVPMYGIVMAFRKLSISGGFFSGEWVGLLYFKQLFTDPAFWNALRNTILIGLYKLVFYFPVPILIAILLNEIRLKWFRNVVQTIIYLPRFISWVIMAGLVMNVLSANGGALNNILGLFGVAPRSFLTEAGSFRAILVITTIIKDSGWSSIIYFAAISSINPELYEACAIDGGGRLRQMWHVTLPGLRPIITIMLIMTVGTILTQDTQQILTLYSPNVYSTGDIIGTYVYRTGIEYGRFSFATAANLFNSVAALILTLTANFVSSKVGDDTLF